MLYRNQLSCWLICSGACLYLAPSTVLAQPSNEEALATLEEVIVTARRREESLQETPVAVTAFSAADLELRNISRVSDVGLYSPNVQFDDTASESGGGGSSQIAIRGIGQTDYVITIEPGVGMYLDGVYLGKSVGSQIDNIDLERVEILRGPQGTLFGKNTIGGAVVITSKRPSDEIEFWIEGTTGEYDRADLKLSGNIPVSDRLRIRATGATQNRDGYVDRIVTGETEGGIESVFGRIVAELDATDHFLATASVDYTDRTDESPGRVLLRADENGFFSSLHNTFDFPACNPTVADPSRFTNPNCFNSQWVEELDDLQNTSRGPNQSDSKVLGTDLNLNWDLDTFSLKSVTAYREVDVDIGQDLAPNPIVYFDYVFQDIELETFSQEFQISGTAIDDRLKYLVGLFSLSEEGSQSFPVRFDPFWLTTGGSIDNTSKAIFAQGTFDVNDRFSVTVGGRYSDEEIRFRPEQEIGEVFNPVITAIIPTVTEGTPILPRVWVESSDSNFSPMATLSYRWTDEVMTYVTYSEGFKSGGFTMRAFPPVIPGVTTPITDPELIIPAFDPETVSMFEVGLKSELFDRRMRLNIAAFTNDYKDLQLLALTGVGGLVPVIFNAGDATIQGIEVESEAVVTDWLRVNAAVGYLNNEYDRVDPNTAGVSIDNKLVNTPDWTWTVGATVDLWSDSRYGAISLRTDWSHKGEQYKDPSNEPLLFQDDYDVLNASLRWTSANENWEAVLGVTNLTDEIYIVSGIDNDGTGITAANPSRPQEWFLRVKYTY